MVEYLGTDKPITHDCRGATLWEYQLKAASIAAVHVGTATTLGTDPTNTCTATARST